MAWTYEKTKAGYASMWRTIKVVKTKDADRFAKTIIANEKRYRVTEAATGVPWFFIGALHMRESSCNFAGVLHNGEKIIGTQKKTRLVPAGRGPFTTWEDAAVDALKLKSLHKIADWNIGRIGYEAERYNGLGYTHRGINSPYLWAGSNHQQPGKFVADGKFDPRAVDTQMGVMTVIKRICELRPDVAARIGGEAEKPKPVPVSSNDHRGAGLFASLAAAIAKLFGRA